MSMNARSFNSIQGNWGHADRSAMAIRQPHGEGGPEHKRLHRYQTLSFDEIAALPMRGSPCPGATCICGVLTPAS